MIKIACIRSGLDADKVTRILTLALGLIDRHAAPDSARRLYDAVPGSEALAKSPAGGPQKSGGLFSGIMRGAAGLSGPAISEAMGAADVLKKDGVDRDTLSKTLKATRRAVEFKTGHDFVGDALKTIPGVGKLLGGE
ncbi:MAG: hypothetical protein EON87_09415 [Brevundimonas sp.]|nr:MAG: hypothetical protein EON87_09415 [Brevundimonas sp.]